MADEQQPYSWIGEAVVAYRPRGYPLYGTLEAVNESGIVMRSSVDVLWGKRDNWDTPEHRESRMLAEFFP